MQIIPGKIVNLLIVVLVFCVALFIVNVNDSLKGLRYQLNDLYETKFDSCLITKIQLNRAHEYASRDDYSVFYTNCSEKGYPILLRANDRSKRDLFNSGNVVTKSAKSLDLRISNETEASTIRLLNPESLDDRPFTTRIILIVMVLAVGIILILPNSIFERKRN